MLKCSQRQWVNGVQLRDVILVTGAAYRPAAPRPRHAHYAIRYRDHGRRCHGRCHGHRGLASLVKGLLLLLLPHRPRRPRPSAVFPSPNTDIAWLAAPRGAGRGTEGHSEHG